MKFPVLWSCEDEQDTSLENTLQGTILIAKTNEQDFPILKVHTVVFFWLPCIRNRSLNLVDLNE